MWLYGMLILIAAAAALFIIGMIMGEPEDHQGSTFADE